MSDVLAKNEFMDLAYDQIERVERMKKILEESRKSSTHTAWPINFMNRECNLDMIYVPISLPMYRLENGRTLSLQDEYLALNQNIPDDFFTRDDNSPEAQSVQHDLLMKLSEIKNILATFQDTTNKQIEPLIITNTGFIVNGNRRLSCWRHLYFEDKAIYKHFEYIRVAVLPEADEKAIDKLEADLQIAPDIKADYSWHAEARMMQKRIEVQREDKDEVAALYRIKRKDIEDRLDMLHYAKQYLKRNNWDRQWSRLDLEKYAFEQLVKERKRLSNPVEQSMFESITYSFVTTGSSGPGEGRIYAKVPEIRKNLIPIIQAIYKELPEILTVNTSINNTELFDDLSVSEQNMANIAYSLVNLDEDNQKKVVELTESVIADENAKERERKSVNYLVDQVKKASIALDNAIEARDEENISTKGLKKLLGAVEKNVVILKTWLNEYENTN